MSDVREGFVVVVFIERKHFLIDVGDKQILPAVSVDVGGIDAHAAARLPVFTEANFGGESHLLPTRFAGGVGTAIDEQEILHGVVGDEQVHAAIVINVGGND